MVQLLWKTIWQFLKKLDYYPYYPAISSLGIHPGSVKTCPHEELYVNVHGIIHKRPQNGKKLKVL